MKYPLPSLQNHGQSVWVNPLRRRLITSGELRKQIREHFSGSDALRDVVTPVGLEVRNLAFSVIFGP